MVRVAGLDTQTPQPEQAQRAKEMQAVPVRLTAVGEADIQPQDPRGVPRKEAMAGLDTRPTALIMVREVEAI